ncbi:MAG TPA: ATP-grasp domain-containing protein [Methylibium sp.]|uniref:ATP-grasp domain-containing protein n=1 Tax=Methylibium sp. TaxID=2067992 RepID=UPI002DBDA8AC|nr:ATP-grasp domain-containing protein [Methylibium sp.]HEU4459797.1 ATP-grasp domain-containing protein [Methylibium sp.]
MRVFVYEYCSGGGANAGAACAAELLDAGRAMRDALVADLADVPGLALTAACRDEAEAGLLRSRCAGAVRWVWPRPGEDAAGFVHRHAARHAQAWIVAPETDGVLMRLAAAVEAPRWIGCTRDALHLASRKRATIARLAAHGLVTPLAFDGEARRWVVKPDDGAGCVATVVHLGHAAARADLHERRARGESATLEPWIDGQAISISLLCGPGGAELLGIHHQSIAVLPEAEGRVRLRDDGVAIDREPRVGERAEALRRVGRAVGAAVPGLRGFVGIDLVWHAARGPAVIEVNPRLTCAFVGLSAALGRPLAREILQAQLAQQAALAAARPAPRQEALLAAS